MQLIHQSLFLIHIIFGITALLLFWVPIVSKKGSLNHRRFGNAYKYVMYVVAGGGILMALQVIAYPLVIKGEYFNGTNEQSFVNQIRSFYAFIIYLGLINIVCIRQGLLALSCKKDTIILRTWPQLSLNIILLLGGIALLAYGALNARTLQIVFGILGIVLAFQNLRYTFAKTLTPKRYLHEHLAGFIGSGIGSYTAFVSFGGRHLFSELGQWQLIFWILPGVIGSFAITYYSKQVEQPQRPKKASSSKQIELGEEA